MVFWQEVPYALHLRSPWTLPGCLTARPSSNWQASPSCASVLLARHLTLPSRLTPTLPPLFTPQPCQVVPYAIRHSSAVTLDVAWLPDGLPLCPLNQRSPSAAPAAAPAAAAFLVSGGAIRPSSAVTLDVAWLPQGLTSLKLAGISLSCRGHKAVAESSGAAFAALLLEVRSDCCCHKASPGLHVILPHYHVAV
jgi:hypothetical protein